MTTKPAVSTPEIFALSSDPSTITDIEVLRLGRKLETKGELIVAFTIPPSRWSNTADMYGAVEVLRVRFRNVHIEAVVGEPKMMLHGPRGVDVHVTLESCIIRLNEAPWHPDNCKGGKEHHRLVEMEGRGKPFIAVYEFDDQPNHREDGPGTLRQVLSNVIDAASWSVIRRDWPEAMFDGKCRIDIRIVPKAGASGKKLTLLRRDDDGHLVLADEKSVKDTLSAFTRAESVTAVFQASMRDAHHACHVRVYSMAATLIGDWLLSHGVEVAGINVTKCERISFNHFRAEFQKMPSVK